jgi:hypothetical protein
LKRPPPVLHLMMRGDAARRAIVSPGLSNLADALVEHLVLTLDRIGAPNNRGYVEAFSALGTAVDLAEALARKPEV